LEANKYVFLSVCGMWSRSLMGKVSAEIRKTLEDRARVTE
jgi:hypothetical protein